MAKSLRVFSKDFCYISITGTALHFMFNGYLNRAIKMASAACFFLPTFRAYLVLSSAKKTCMLDPIPTLLVVNCLDVLLSYLKKMKNTSCMSGHFADGWNCPLVNPLFKKP